MGLGCNSHVVRRWERIARQWWLYALLVLIQFLPPYISRGFDWSVLSWKTYVPFIVSSYSYILTHAIIRAFPAPVIPVIQSLALLMVSVVFLWGNRGRRLFALYVAASYFMFAVLQTVSVTSEHGAAIILVYFGMFVVVAGFWLWEALTPSNDFTPQTRSLQRYWVLPLALLAFWNPISPTTFGPEWRWQYVFTSGSSLTFCMMTAVYLAVLVLFYPTVNRVIMGVTGLMGLIIGLLNLLGNFVLAPNMWWNGVLHLPLVILSLHALRLSRQTPESPTMS